MRTRAAAVIFGILGVLAMSGPTKTQTLAGPGRVPDPVADHTARVVRRMNPGQMLRLTLVLQPRNSEAFEQLLRDQVDPSSPRFRRYLTFAEWKARFAPEERDVVGVAAWARQSGLTVLHRFQNNLAMKIEADAATIERTFGVQMSHYQAGDRAFFSNDRAAAFPAQLAHVLKNVVGLNDYVRMRNAAQPASAVDMAEGPMYRGGPFIREESSSTDADRSKARLAPQICCGSSGVEVPDLFSSEAYNLGAFQRFSQCCNPAHGAGGSPKETSIAIIGLDAIALTDVQAFAARYGMAVNLTQVSIDGPACCDSEMTLDAELAVAMANSFGAAADTAHVYVYASGGRNIGDGLDSWEAAHSYDQARVASTSFATYEDAYGGLSNPSISDYTDVINAMAAIGWTMVAASGDHGATADCKTLSVAFPASSPNVVAAGGTSLLLSSSGTSFTFSSESAWNGPGCGGTSPPGQNLGGGGGGCSNNQPPVYWQDMVTGQCGDKRALPDISLDAAGGVAWFYGNRGGWTASSGTSVVAPELAGFFAQVNSYLLSLGRICGASYNAPCAPFGNPNPAIWVMGWAGISPTGRAPFYDINDGSCNGGQGQTGYCTSTGYDLATGWGSINMLQLGWGLMGVVTNGAAPDVSFTGPATNSWYNADRSIDFTVHAPSPQGTSASVGVAGHTAQWDVPVADVLSHPTPGSGDSYYNGPQQESDTASLGLVSAGAGCHTAHVRGWDNTGRTTSDRTYGPVCYDNIPPSVRCASPDGVWHPTDVSIVCSAADQQTLSGLANPLDSLFGLVTAVPPGTETGNAFTSTRHICDVAGNCVDSGPFGGNMVDKKPPSIGIISPTAAEYVLNQPVLANYVCTDEGSGSATCAGAVPNGSAIDTASAGSKTFAVGAADNVGNASSASVGYAVTYRVCLKYDANQPIVSRAVEVRVQLCDYTSANVSRSSIVLTATAVDGSTSKAVPLGALNPGNLFLYGPGAAPGASYLYVLDGRGLGTGVHTLSFKVLGDPIEHSAPFTIRR